MPALTLDYDRVNVLRFAYARAIALFLIAVISLAFALGCAFATIHFVRSGNYVIGPLRAGLDPMYVTTSAGCFLVTPSAPRLDCLIPFGLISVGIAIAATVRAVRYVNAAR